MFNLIMCIVLIICATYIVYTSIKSVVTERKLNELHTERKYLEEIEEKYEILLEEEMNKLEKIKSNEIRKIDEIYSNITSIKIALINYNDNIRRITEKIKYYESKE